MTVEVNEYAHLFGYIFVRSVNTCDFTHLETKSFIRGTNSASWFYCFLLLCVILLSCLKGDTESGGEFKILLTCHLIHSNTPGNSCRDLILHRVLDEGKTK